MTKVKLNSSDTVSRIAGETGFAPDTIWSHPDNASLKEKRDHMDVLAEGDQLTVPEMTPKSVPAATCMRHRFRRRGVPIRFILQVLDAWGNMRKERPYRLVVDGTTFEGTTDANGVLRHFMPNSARVGKLYLDELELDFIIGELDPKSGLLGAQQRLTNLGFPCLADAGEMGRATAIALMRFQHLMGLNSTGKLDDATCKALDDHHQQLDRLAEHLANMEPNL